MEYLGVVMGAVVIAAVGFGHVLVVRWEYYWGATSWPGMLLIGVGLLVGSLFSGNAFVGGTLGIFGAVLLWGVYELFRQGERVEQGLFPKNPRRSR